MGHRSTRVSDTKNVCSAAGMVVKLQQNDRVAVETLPPLRLNADGCNEGGALTNAQSMTAGHYRLFFRWRPIF